MPYDAIILEADELLGLFENPGGTALYSEFMQLVG